uniref:(northern house mosquito) hypothetical protein n=1 Tax=Culex pipiens TaxID=7175 RepID=A0A8D8ER58_CULPI
MQLKIVFPRARKITIFALGNRRTGEASLPRRNHASADTALAFTTVPDRIERQWRQCTPGMEPGVASSSTVVTFVQSMDGNLRLTDDGRRDSCCSLVRRKWHP